MDFDKSDLQRLLFDSASRYIEERFTLEHRRALRDSGEAFDREAWKTFAELGWLAILIPEEAGGVGGSITDAAVLAEVLGSRCVTEPFPSTAVLAPTILAGAQSSQAGLMAEIGAGVARVALAHDEPAERYGTGVHRATTLARRGRGYILNGQKMMVLDAPSATHVIVTAKSSGGLALILVNADAENVACDPYRLYDGTRAADVRYDATPVGPESILAQGDTAEDLLSHALERTRVIGYAQSVGSIDRELEICSAYLKEREQFGQPIGKFQALQHIMAEMFVEAHQARSALYFALSKIDGTSAGERERAVALAGLKVMEAAQLVSRQAIQLHGGYGVTDEYEVSHHYRRQFVLEKLYGDMDYLSRRVALHGPL